MSVTTQRPTQTVRTPDAPAVEHRRTPWFALVVGVLAVVTVGLVVAWNLPRDEAAPASTTGWTAGYGPGSAVYREQVPQVAPRWEAAYGPGSSLYAQQVPSDPSAWTRAYGPGSSVYAEQVPVGPASWAAAYGPGSSVYAQQVPQVP